MTSLTLQPIQYNQSSISCFQKTENYQNLALAKQQLQDNDFVKDLVYNMDEEKEKEE